MPQEKGPEGWGALTLVTCDAEPEVAMAGRAHAHTKALVHLLLERGYPGLRASFVGEHCCSQTNINQARSPAQCPTVPEKGAYRERPFSVQGTAQPGRHAGSHWAMVWGPRSCLFKGLVKELALPSGLFMG